MVPAFGAVLVFLLFAGSDILVQIKTNTMKIITHPQASPKPPTHGPTTSLKLVNNTSYVLPPRILLLQ
jgi:hypothetical protein